MNKAKEISVLWSEIKPQIGELVRLCHEVESHEEVTADAYQRGYENGFVAGHLKAEKSGQSFYEDGYQYGLNDAWDAARKIVSIPTAELHTMFDKAVYYDTVFRDCTASEAIEKIRQYEQKKEKEKSITAEEVMRQYLDIFCNKCSGCTSCVLNTSDFTCGRGYHFLTDNRVSDEEVRRAYTTVLQKMKEE